MIPTNNQIKGLLVPENTYHFVMNTENYFEVAEEFLRLQTLFVKESMFEVIMQWFEMVISPLLTLFFSWWKPPSVFSMMTIQKSIDLWINWYKFRELGGVIRKWTNIVRSVNGPFISTNHGKYHVYVYADGMQRIRNSLLEGRCAISKEGAKRL
jgi:hypothetical protein